jgi:hypothetical protein
MLGMLVSSRFSTIRQEYPVQFHSNIYFAKALKTGYYFAICFASQYPAALIGYRWCEAAGSVTVYKNKTGKGCR